MLMIPQFRPKLFEDLQLAASLFEEYCKDNRLFISISNSFITVFHNASATGVSYSDGAVHVDGRRVAVSIHGETLAATQSFKYLGVHLDACFTFTSHFENRLGAFDRACHLLLSGLSRMPAFPHKFLMYAWTSLIVPVMSYGMDVYAHPDQCIQKTRSKERKWWRRFLQVGGRAPNAAVQVLFGCPPIDICWRVQRAALLLRLANAPAGSWVHLAIIAHHTLQTPWFVDALKDLELVLPHVRLVPTMVRSEPYLSSSVHWNDEGEWISLHAWCLPCNPNGRRFRPRHGAGNDENMRKSIKRHITNITQKLRLYLVRESWSSTYEEIVTAATATPNSKLTFLAITSPGPGPPATFCARPSTHPLSQVTFVVSILWRLVLGQTRAQFLCQVIASNTPSPPAGSNRFRD